MHSREELFREAQRQVAARRQQAVTLAQQVSEQAHRAIPELRACEDEITRLGFERAQLAAKGANSETLVPLRSLSRATPAPNAGIPVYTMERYAAAFCG